MGTFLLIGCSFGIGFGFGVLKVGAVFANRVRNNSIRNKQNLV